MINQLRATVVAAALWNVLRQGLRTGTDWGSGDMESNARYYSRRAVEERMAAQRAVTETARAWHAKLAHDFAERAASACSSACATTDSPPAALRTARS